MPLCLVGARLASWEVCILSALFLDPTHQCAGLTWLAGETVRAAQGSERCVRRPRPGSRAGQVCKEPVGRVGKAPVSWHGDGVLFPCKSFLFCNSSRAPTPQDQARGPCACVASVNAAQKLPMHQHGNPRRACSEFRAKSHPEGRGTFTGLQGQAPAPDQPWPDLDPRQPPRLLHSPCHVL